MAAQCSNNFVIFERGCSGGYLAVRTLKLGSYTEIVARGWESKSVEDQIEAAQDRNKSAPRLSPEEIAKQTRVEGFLLQRTRLLRDLDKSRKNRHRAVLTAGLEYLEQQLAEMGWVPPGQGA